MGEITLGISFIIIQNIAFNFWIKGRVASRFLFKKDMLSLESVVKEN
jgi:hypothetical protein